MFALWARDAPKKTAKELVKEQKKAMRSTERQLGREMRSTEKREKALLTKIKKTAASGNTVAAKALAKQVVNTRQTHSKLEKTSGTIGAIGNQMNSMTASLAMSNAMGQSVKVMQAMNEQMNPMEQQALAQRFSEQNDVMALQSDMFDDLFDGMMESDEDAEADALIEQVLDEVMMEKTGDMPSAIRTGHGTAVEGSSVLDALEQRQARLMGEGQ